MKPRLSIVVPVYNVEKYLEQCLSSIANQTSSAYEVIIVDDGSTDSCAEICDKYSEKYDYIRVIHKMNGGLSSARNAGIQSSKGEYICFVDSDDYVESHYVETIINNIVDNIDLLSFQYKMVRGNTFDILPDKDNKDYFFYSEEESFSFLITEIFKKMNWSAWTHCFKRRILMEYGLYFEDNNRIFAEDLYFIFGYCSLIQSARYIRNPLYNYRVRKNSIMDVEIKNLNVGRMNELSKCLLSFYKNSKKKYYVQNYPIIHYLVIRNVLYRALILNNQPQKEFRKKVLNDIEDTTFFLSYLKQLIDNKKLFYTYIDDKNSNYDYNYLKYLYDGSLMKSKFRTIIRIMKSWWKKYE